MTQQSVDAWTAIALNVRSALAASLMIGCRGEALTGDIRIDPTEIEDAIWVTREDMLSAMAGQHPTLLPARKGAIAHFLLRNWLADTLD